MLAKSCGRTGQYVTGLFSSVDPSASSVRCRTWIEH